LIWVTAQRLVFGPWEYLIRELALHLTSLRDYKPFIALSSAGKNERFSIGSFRTFRIATGKILRNRISTRLVSL